MNYSWSDKFIFIIIISLFVIPFSLLMNYFPLAKFYSEIIALILGSIFAVIVFIKQGELALSNISIACILFAAILLLQLLFINIRFEGVNLAVAIEFIICAFVAAGVTTYANYSTENFTKLLTMIAWSAVIGASIQAIIAYLQFTAIASTFPNLMLYQGREDPANFFGNIGQRNQFADFIAIGLFALSYLYFKNLIHKYFFIIYALFFLVVISICAARTPIVYYIISLIISLVYIYKNKTDKANNRKLIILMGLLFLGLIVVELIIPKLTVLLGGNPSDASSGITRMTQNVGQTTYRRFYEWLKALVVFTQHPILGVGWYQYPREGIYLMLTERFMYIPANMALYTNAHNSLVNVLAETGIIGFLISFGYGVFYAIYRILKFANSYDGLFVVFLLTPILIHSLHEYPLWYAYFLVIFVMLLAFNPPVYVLKQQKIVISLSISLLTIFLLFMINIVNSYNNLLSYSAMSRDLSLDKSNVVNLQELIDNSYFWSLPALMVLDNYNMPDTQLTNLVLTPQEQLKYVNKIALDLPYPGAIFKQIILYQAVGDHQQSIYYANLLAHAYPNYKEQFMQQLATDIKYSDQVAVMAKFQYQDRSFFAKKKF